ncbi:hypothetical protein KIW84_076381 [Lathyrus oleraceus]|uniref:Uncharacterized protein n=1 Tax=Pisum sativum TaxID=3888 RepID=A0A9D4VXW8_PEA|nr:hypothetical protein KIW84_076381 [Pisum sativum]
MARSRRAILLDIKWACLESLLSIPSHALKNGIHLEENYTFFSDDTLRCIFGDLVESLENVGGSSVLSMLRSLRMLFELVAKVTPSAVVSCSHVIDAQVIWNLSMHQRDNAPGPLKWFIENLLEEGRKSPRTIRPSAVHLTGLWLLNPIIIKFYLKELKLLSLYGSVAFDEDFEELYARVPVAVLFYKLADLACMVESPNEDVDCMAALDSAVNDKDLAKELYKKNIVLFIGIVPRTIG